MTILGSVVVSILTGLLCGGGALLLAIRCVAWYRITSREGCSGYFVVMLAILGAVAGLIAGMVIGLAVGAGDLSGFLRALGYSIGGVVTVLGIVALIARLRADVAPKLNGQPLDLCVEVRLPAAQQEPPRWASQETSLSLASVGRRVQRRAENGALKLTGLRRDEGRWIVPGTAPIFTQRGRRVIRVKLGSTDEAFLVPLPARPGTRQKAWSDWLPRPRRDGGAAINTLSFRYRVEPRKE